MEPRTVILTLELQNCELPLEKLRQTRHVLGYEAGSHYWEDDLALWGHAIAQATATVAQPSKKRR